MTLKINAVDSLVSVLKQVAAIKLADEIGVQTSAVKNLKPLAEDIFEKAVEPKLFAGEIIVPKGRFETIQELVEQGKISKERGEIYMSNKIGDTEIKLIFDYLKYQNNPRLRELVSEYKTDSRPFQNYTKVTDQVKRDALEKELAKTILPFDISAKRGEDWGFLNTKTLPNGKNLGEEIRGLMARNVGEEEIKKLLNSFDDVENFNFMSTSIGSVERFESKPVQYDLFIPQGTTGVYLEDLIKPELQWKYESELLLQLKKLLHFKNILFKNKQCFIDAVVTK